MTRRLKWIVSICLLLGLALLILPWFFDARPSTRLKDGIIVRLERTSAPGAVTPTWRLALRRLLHLTSAPPRWAQSQMIGSHPAQHLLLFHAKGAAGYVCTITGPNGERFGDSAASLLALPPNDLFILLADEFPPTETMEIHFYKDDGARPQLNPGSFVQLERLQGTLIVPTPRHGRMVPLATKPFPSKTNFADVEVSVEKVELFPEPLLDQRKEWMGRAYLGFRENGVLTTNWDTGWFSRVDHHRGNFPLSGPKEWKDGLREIYFSYADRPELGWKIRADIVRKKNFPEHELILITNVPAPGSGALTQDWEFTTNWSGSLITLKAMQQISLTFAGAARPLQPPVPGLLVSAPSGSALVPRIARVEADTGELLHDPVNRWGDEWSSVAWSAPTHAPRAHSLEVWVNVQKPRRIQLAGVPDRLTNTPALSH